jgi:hypothetical protein
MRARSGATWGSKEESARGGGTADKAMARERSKADIVLITYDYLRRNLAADERR